VVHIGEGTNIWGNIHINDLVQLYLVVIKNALVQHQKAIQTDAYNNYFFATSGENSIRSITELIAPLLYKKGA
jgi:nucleoside-diphosphate-sugar epimerase